tara:strand:- start:3653 stop:4141 length:489 start_codon:yes stop_codon:yes gene_type:complete
MIVPKEHFNSFAEMGSSASSELEEMKNKIRSYGKRRLAEEYVFFESGAGKLTTHSGGCIIHAHLHALALCSEFDNRIFREIKLSKVSESSFYEIADKEFGYVSYTNAKDEYFLCNQPLLPSQFLRYLYAQCNNAEAYWNWRRHINISGVKEVIRTYSKFCSD